jgi:class 3 adenylate cyclase
MTNELSKLEAALPPKSGSFEARSSRRGSASNSSRSGSASYGGRSGSSSNSSSNPLTLALRNWTRNLVSAPRFLSVEDKAQFHSNLAVTLLARVAAFAWLTIAIHGPLLLRDALPSNSAPSAAELEWHTWLWRLHALILAAASGVLLALRTPLLTPRRKVQVAFGFVVLLLTWAAWIAGVDQLINAGISVYLVVALAAALFVTFDARATAFVFCCGLVTLGLGQWTFQPNRALALSHSINGVGLSLMCWLFSRMLYNGKVTAFVQRATIANQHRELKQINAQLTATVTEVTRLNQELSQNLALLDRERARGDALLHAVLPERVVARMLQGDTHIADAHRDVIVMFADLSGFTPLGTTLSARDLVSFLDDLFSRFDAIVSYYDLEKVKTVGDAYLAAVGLRTDAATLDPMEAAACVGDAALNILDTVHAFARERNTVLSVRIGITQGDVVGGVLGERRLVYDIWGDAVNLASRLEHAATPGEILVAEPFAAQLAASHDLGPLTIRELKGKGLVGTRSLLGRRSDSA